MNTLPHQHSWRCIVECIKRSSINSLFVVLELLIGIVLIVTIVIRLLLFLMEIILARLFNEITHKYLRGYHRGRVSVQCYPLSDLKALLQKMCRGNDTSSFVPSHHIDLYPIPTRIESRVSDEAVLERHRVVLVTGLTPNDSCPVCHDPLTNPCRTVCGHIYCSHCLATWLRTNDTCPSCRRDLVEGRQDIW
jgi:RNA polymerase subunit RPABC4/transcription elongation factor Spt4